MLAPWKESYEKPRQHIKQQRNHFPTKVHIVKAMFFFPVVICRCYSSTIKEAECQRIDSFELWCWRRLLRIPWTAKRPNQSILKEINPDYLLKELMLNLQYFGQLMQRANSLELEKTLLLGKIEGKRKRGWHGMKWLDNITTSMDMNLRKLWETVEDRVPWYSTVLWVAKSWTWFSDRTIICTCVCVYVCVCVCLYLCLCICMHKAHLLYPLSVDGHRLLPNLRNCK